MSLGSPGTAIGPRSTFRAVLERSARPATRGSRTTILPGIAQVEADDAAAEQPAALVELGEFGQARSAPRLSPSGKATTSPDWKLRSQRRPPTQVAEASCGSSVGTVAHHARAARAPGDWRRDRSATAGRASCRPAPGRAPRLRCRSARAALVLPQRRRRALDDVDDQRIGQAPRHARILDPAELEQPLRGLRRHRPAVCGALAAPASSAARRSSLVDRPRRPARGPCA